MDENSLSGKVALVTGAAGGMGTAIAQQLAALGAWVALNDRSAESLATVAESLRVVGAEVVIVAADVTIEREVEDMLATIAARWGPVDVLVNNAGVLRPTRFLDISAAEWDFVVSVNLTGTFLCSRAVLPAMISQGWGRIVNLSSTAGKNVSTVGGAHYTAAKAAILGLTRHLASEVGRDGVTVNAICPGLFDTEMVRATISPEQVEAYAQGFPIARLGRPDEVAGLVAFLASNAAGYITGASLDINGGDLMI